MTDKPVQISLTPDQVNQWLTQAVLDSTLGQQVKDVIEAELGKLFEKSYSLSHGFDTAVGRLVREEVLKLVREYILVEHVDAIRAKVKEAITDAVISRLIAAAVDTTMDRIRHG